MSQAIDDHGDEKSLFDEVDVDGLLEETPGEEEAKEMAERNK